MKWKQISRQIEIIAINKYYRDIEKSPYTFDDIDTIYRWRTQYIDNKIYRIVTNHNHAARVIMLWNSFDETTAQLKKITHRIRETAQNGYKRHDNNTSSLNVAQSVMLTTKSSWSNFIIHQPLTVTCTDRVSYSRRRHSTVGFAHVSKYHTELSSKVRETILLSWHDNFE